MSALAKSLRLSAALLALAATGAQAGGPLSICDDAGRSPIAYGPAPATVTLNYDLGTLGSRSKEQADALMLSSVALWTNVTTSNITIARGADLPVDVTPATLGTYLTNFGDGVNPVIYDTDGAIVDALMGAGAKNSVLGFAGSVYYNYFEGFAASCRYVEGRAVISGFLAINDATMSTTLAHEIGHLIGLSHTQIDNEQGLTPSFPSNYPLMYPIAYRDTADLHEDDVAAVTALYPDTNVATNYGEITGMFQTADGMTPVLGANLWAKETTTNKLYSIVSDFRTQGNGYYRLLLPPGTYNLFAGVIRTGFTGGSSVGPYSEDWSGASFQPPLYSVGGVGGGSPVAPTGPMAMVTLGGMTPTPILITAACVATLNFRINGTGTVGGNCVPGPAAAPTIGTATAGAGQVSVTFTPGSLNGGVLTHHHVTCAADTGPAFDGYGGSSPIVVTGLTGGTAYRCWARTITNLGTSPWSGATNYATPTSLTGPPSAPVIGTATAGAGQVSVTFTPGSLNGGVLTNHHVTCTAATGPAFNGFGSSSPIVVTGLTGGTAYRCWARTITNLGTSPWSGATNYATPTSVTGPPSAPVIGTATAGAGQVSVAFTPGSLNGGVLTNHHATCAAASGPAFNGYGASSPIVVTGLTAGTAYRCWVRTITNLGTSGWSGATNYATPTGVTGPPSAPTIGMATAGAGQVSVAFTPGSLNGGVLTNHQATCAAASGPAFYGTAMASPIVVTGLTAGTAYRCWVRTITNLGTSPWSGATNYATPTSVTGPPSAPTIGMATAGAGQVSVAFTPGSLNGGVLTNHQATCAAASGPAFYGTAMASPIVVTGLTAGTAYRCWVRTITNLGTSPWSGATNYATPTSVTGPPSAPVMGTATAGAGQVSVTFTPGSLNGGVLTNHHVACAAASGPGFNGYGTSSPIVVAGLTSGTPYRCWVRTTTNLGTSGWSGASNYATPTNGPPAAPIIGMATAGNTQVSVAFTPGSLNGGVLTHHQATCVAASGPAFYGTAMASPIVVTGLSNGTAYRCWVHTVTNLGTGAWSMASNYATPSM